MSGIKIPVSADFDGSDVEASIARLSSQMNKLGQAVAAANRMKFTPVDQATMSDLKKVEAQFRELMKISGGLRDRMKATGQGNAGFSGVDWNRLYDDPVTRQRKMSQAFQHVTRGTQFGGALSGTPAPAAPADAPQPQRQHGPGFGSTLGGIASAGLRATGPVGGVVANAGAAGMSGGLSAGLFGLVGGLAALGIGKGIGMVKDKVDAAGQEGVGYDTLKRTLGDVDVSFNLLRQSLRSASDNIDVTFEQSQKLGTDFAKLSGITRDQYKSLSDEVSVGGGFGRSFGVDPEASNSFFAQMRSFRVTENTNDSRRLALMIGEAVGKSGSFGKMDEVLQVISSFASTQSREGLAGANVAGYAGSLSGMLASKVPGLDVHGAAALLGRANSAIMGGGAIGEAGQNYLFSALGKKNGLDPVQVALLQQQGAFGTGRMAFGDNSLYQKFSGKFGAVVPGEAADSDKTNISTILEKIQKDYSSNPSLMLNATARLLGVNENQAMALHTISPQNLGGMSGRMGRLGLDMGALSATGISAMASIETGDRGALMGQADSLRKSKKSLSIEEAQRLSTAVNSGDTEQLRDILTELTYSREQEQTEGSKTRASIQGLDKRMQELATHLVGPMNDMRNALVLMAGGGKLGATGIAESVLRVESSERMNNLGTKNKADIEAQRSIIKEIGGTDSVGQLRSIREDLMNTMKGNGTEAEKETARKEYVAKRTELVAMREAAQKRIVELMAEMANAEKAEKAKLEADVTALRIKAAPGGGAAGGGGASTASKKEFEAQYGAAAKRAGTALGVDPKLILSQWGVETGWGKSVIPGTNNLGNIKDFTGKGVAARDNMTGSMDKYRAFGSADEFADHYVGLMQRKYKGVIGAGSDGAKFTSGLAGYAEDPNYGAKIIGGSSGLFAAPPAKKPTNSAMLAYNSGWGQKPRTTDYLGMIQDNREYFATPMPAGAPAQPAGSQPIPVMVNGEFTLRTPTGQRVADPLRTKTRVSLPSAAGGQP